MPDPNPGPPGATPRSTRADARRNHERLLAAAQAAFTEHGAEASLEGIARRAGLGSATLHRHFPSRYALMEAVYWSQIQELCAAGDRLLDAPSPGDALATWLREVVTVAAQRGLATAMMATSRDHTERLLAACHDAIDATGGALLSRAQQAGTVRADVQLGDLLQVANAIALTVEHDPDASARADRLLELLIEGIHRREPGSTQT
jgi:AcrR family transcriptional regulator